MDQRGNTSVSRLRKSSYFSCLLSEVNHQKIKALFKRISLGVKKGYLYTYKQEKNEVFNFNFIPFRYFNVETGGGFVFIFWRETCTVRFQNNIPPPMKKVLILAASATHAKLEKKWQHHLTTVMSLDLDEKFGYIRFIQKRVDCILLHCLYLILK
jgi:hypothetical protein